MKNILLNFVLKSLLVLGLSYYLLSCSKESVNVVQNTDKTPPTITSITPNNGEKNVQPSYYPNVLFSEVMDLSTITSENLYLTKKDGTKVSCKVSTDLMYNGDTRTTFAQIIPNELLIEGEEYRIYITDKCADISGNKMTSSNTSYTFTIADRHGPTLVEIKVISKKKIQLCFNEDIQLLPVSLLKQIKLVDNRIHSEWWFNKDLSIDNIYKNRLNIEINEEFFVGDEINIDYYVKDLNGNIRDETTKFVVPINSWPFAVPRSMEGTNISFINNKYFIIADRKLHCLDEKGKLLWSTVSFGYENLNNYFSITVNNSSVIVLMAAYGFELKKFDIANGNLIDTKEKVRSESISRAEFLYSGNYIIATYNTYHSYYVETFDMNLNSISLIKIDETDIFGSSALISGNLYIQKAYPYPGKYGISSIPDLKMPTNWTTGVLGARPMISSDGKLLLTDLAMYKLASDNVTLQAIWTKQLSGASFSPIGNLYCGEYKSSDAVLVKKVDSQNGSTIWETNITGETISISSVVSDDKIVVALFGKQPNPFRCHNIITLDAITGNQKE